MQIAIVCVAPPVVGWQTGRLYRREGPFAEGALAPHARTAAGGLTGGNEDLLGQDAHSAITIDHVERDVVDARGIVLV